MKRDFFNFLFFSYILFVYPDYFVYNSNRNVTVNLKQLLDKPWKGVCCNEKTGS